MIEPNTPELNSDGSGDELGDELMKKAQDEATRRHVEQAGLASTGQDALPHQQARAELRASFEASTAAMEHLIGTGPRIPEWTHLQGLRRTGARLTARIVQYVTSFIVNWQNEVNQATLQSVGVLEEQIQDGAAHLARLKTELLVQERRITLLLEEARKRLPEPFDHEQLSSLAAEDRHRLDALYLSLEDAFRGTREDIKERLHVYLPILKQAELGTEHMPVLDVGCGRGEWLEVLGAEGLVATGVDDNRILIEQCQQRELSVVEGDCLVYLRSLPDASMGAVTVFHLIEHLPFGVLVALFDEIVRVLKPGGLAVFETPNPHNMLVGSYNFYFDPTHRNPLPSAVVQLLAEARGLCRVTVEDLHPYPESIRMHGSQVAERLSDYLYGPQDYAVMGWKG